jgi:hypothetical protein
MVDTPVSTTKRKWQMKRRMPITLPGSRMSRAALAVLIGVAVISMSDLPGLKAQGNSAVALSNGGEGWEASAAIDGAGNSVAVWIQRSRNPSIVDQIWSRGQPANGQWGEKSVLSGNLQTVEAFPAVHAASSGAATVVWSNTDGIWTADRSPGGIWSQSQLIVPGPFLTRHVLVMNSQGDAALLWGSGADQPGAATQLNARRRQAGGAWGAPEVVATGNGNRVTFAHAAIAENTGDVVASWETFRLVGCPYCQFVDIVLHVSRISEGSSTWQDSGPLTPSSASFHNGYPAVDPAGAAGVVYLKDLATLVSINQSGAGAGWSAPVQVYTAPRMFLSGLEIDLSGRATVALLDASAGKVIAIDGSIVDNSWGNAVNVSAGDPWPSVPVFALGTSGHGVLSWAFTDANQTNYVVRLAVRQSSGAPWSAPRTISPSLPYAFPEAAAVNAAGKTIVIFGGYNTAQTIHTEFATTN